MDMGINLPPPLKTTPLFLAKPLQPPALNVFWVRIYSQVFNTKYYSNVYLYYVLYLVTPTFYLEGGDRPTPFLSNRMLNSLEI